MKKLPTNQIRRLSLEEFRQAEKTPITVVLDNIRSQNNIGSIFRTADAFRIQKICLCGICSTPPHRDIHKTALGAEQSVNWQYYPSSKECLTELKNNGYRIFAIEQVDDSLKLGHTPIPLPQDKCAIILGNEIHGVDDNLLPLCDHCLEIPQYGTKHSLNVSCAAAIILWELHKLLQRNQ